MNKKVNQVKLNLLNNFFENPTTSAIEAEDMFIVQMFGRPEFKAKFDGVKDKAPYVYKNLLIYKKAMDASKKYYDKMKKGNVSRSEMVVAGYVANVMRSNTESFVDTHMRFMPNPENTRTANMHHAESDIIVKMNDRMVAILIDGIWHKIREQDDIARTEIFKDNGYEVIRVRETGLPLISNKVCASINLNDGISTEEGCKEAAFALVDKINKMYNLNLANNEELYASIAGAPELYYEQIFNDERFYSSIPEDTRSKITDMYNKCAVIEGKKAKVTRAQLKKEAKEMKISKNVKAAFATFSPDTYKVLRKYW